MEKQKPNLGDRAKDVITGFSGIVTGKCQYITGCNQALVVPPCKPDGESVGAQWFDEDRLEVLEAGAIKLNVTDPGPDLPAPIK